MEGPQYLGKAEEGWPETTMDISLDVGDKEVRREAAVNAVNIDKTAPTRSAYLFLFELDKTQKGCGLVPEVEVQVEGEVYKEQAVAAFM